MHRRTYERLCAAHNAYVAQSLAGMAAKLGLSMQRLKGTNELALSIEERACSG